MHCFGGKSVNCIVPVMINVLLAVLAMVITFKGKTYRCLNIHFYLMVVQKKLLLLPHKCNVKSTICLTTLFFLHEGVKYRTAHTHPLNEPHYQK